MKDLRLTITVRNNILMRAVENAGFDSIAAFSRAHGLSYAAVVDFVGLRLAPIDSRGEWRLQAVKMADALKALPEDLFPDAFLTRALERNRVEREVSSEEIPALGFGGSQSIAYDPEAGAIRKEALAAMRVALGTLRPRELAVLTALYGLNDGAPKTLEEVGEALGVTRERVRQMKLRGERRLQSGQGVVGEKMKIAKAMLEHDA